MFLRLSIPSLLWSVYRWDHFTFWNNTVFTRPFLWAVLNRWWWLRIQRGVWVTLLHCTRSEVQCQVESPRTRHSWKSLLSAQWKNLTVGHSLAATVPPRGFLKASFYPAVCSPKAVDGAAGVIGVLAGSCVCVTVPLLVRFSWMQRLGHHSVKSVLVMIPLL